MGYPENLYTTINAHSISVGVRWQHRCWDFLLSEDVVSVKSASGYICGLCTEAGEAAPFPSRDALWADHLFNSLLDWVNHKLFAARAIGLFTTEDGGASWAKLLMNRDESARTVSTPYLAHLISLRPP